MSEIDVSRGAKVVLRKLGAVADLDRNTVDVNVHWFTTSHIELALNARYETLAFGSGGRSGAYSLLQLHYRL